MNPNRQTALVTGPTSGIGLELAKQLAEAGFDLVLVARRADRLQELGQQWRDRYGIHTTIIPTDLAVQGAAASIVKELQAQSISIDVLVNNAGFGAAGEFDHIPLDRQSSMIQVNVTALTELTHYLLPEMRRRARGGILNVGSTAAFQSGPAMAVYYATKAYVLSFSEALHEELRGSGVRVCCLCPGVTVSEFIAEAGVDGSLLVRLGAMQASGVARIGLRGFLRGRTIVIPGFKNRLGTWLVRCLPRGLVRRVVHLLNRTKTQGQAEASNSQ